LLKAETKAAGDVAKDAKTLAPQGGKELPHGPDVPKDVHPPKATTAAESAHPESVKKPDAAKTPQSEYPQELAAGFSREQIEAADKFFGKTFDKLPDFNLRAKWDGSLNSTHVQNARAGAAKDQVRGHFDSTRNKFWEKVFDDTVGDRKAIEDAGFVFSKRGNAPTMTLPNGKVTSLDVDHFTRLTDNPSIALDSNNLRLIFPRENRVALEQLRRLDLLQFKPFRPLK
jgi:hypothetical protein